jgi:glycine oxidase
MYLVRKANGTTLAGATEEYDSGFANHPTPQGRQQILQAALHMAPSLGEAEVIDQVAGLQPRAQDGLPLIGPGPGWQGLYMVPGHFRSGMLLSAVSTKLVADLIEHG